MIQEAEKNAIGILNTWGAEGIRGCLLNNCVAGDCAKMLSNGGGAEIFPTIWEMIKKLKKKEE